MNFDPRPSILVSQVRTGVVVVPRQLIATALELQHMQLLEGETHA